MKWLSTIVLCLFATICVAQTPHYNQWLIDMNKSNKRNFFEIQQAFEKAWEGKEYKKGTGYKQFRRWEYAQKGRVDKDGNLINPYLYSREYEKFNQLHTPPGDSSANWSPLGPTSWQNGGSGYNPGIGRVNAVTVAPQDSNIIFIAAASGGIWKSTDGGTSWNTTTDYITLLGTSDIAIDPNDINTVYIATGDRDGLDTYGLGVLISRDGGLTWDTTALSFNQNSESTVTNKLLHHPDSSGVLFAATNNGLFKTSDFGNTWTEVNSLSFKDLEFQPGNPAVVFAANTHLYKSVDGGATFVEKENGLPATVGRMVIGVTPADSNYIYVLVANNLNEFEGFYKSTDAGETYLKMLDNSLNLLGYAQDGSDNGSQAWYDLAIAVSPINPEEVYTGGVNIWKTTDGGTNWEISSHWYYLNDPSIYSHADIHSLDFYHNTLFCGSDGGIFKKNSVWSDLSSGLNIMQIYRMGGSPTNSEVIASGAQDNGTNLYTNGTWLHMHGADGMEAAISPVDPDLIYGSWQNGNILKSTDGGNSMSSIFNPDSYNQDCNWVTPFEVGPDNPNHVWVACNSIYKTENGGSSWIDFSGELSFSSIDVMKISKNNTDVIYTATGKILQYTRDGGNSWEQKVIPYPITEIKDIAIAEYNDSLIYLCAGGYEDGNKVYFSMDAGQTFENISKSLPNLPANTLVLDKEHPGAIYVGMDLGVYFIDSTMEDWVSFNQNLPNVIISELEIHYGSQKLRAATYGRGIWETPLFPSVSSTNYREFQHAWTIFPQPSSGKVNIDLKDLDMKNFEVVVYNSAGSLIKKKLVKNKKTVSFDLSNETGGIYFVKINNGTYSLTKKLLIRK